MGEMPTIGRYRVLSTLGTGAMGEVLRARDERLGRDVAIKRVKNVFGQLTSLFHARFDAEARALAALAHPSVVQVFDLGYEDETPYLVMELVEGPSLRQVLDEKGPLSVPAARSLGIQLARALEAAHARGILHRDIKPANVLQGPGGIWKLADFGVARVPDSEMTVAGSFMGTPAYAAPEALVRGDFSPASDVFGLAVMLAEAVTGSKPRPSGTLAEMMARANVPVPLTGVPAEIAATLAPALAIDPTSRPGAGALAEALAGGRAPSAALASAAAAAAPTPDVTIAVPESTIAVPDETVMTVGTVPVAPRPDRGRLVPYVLGGVVAFAGLVAMVSTCSGSGDKRATKPPERSTFEDERASGSVESNEPAVPDEPPFDPEESHRFEMPRGLDRRGAEEWRKVAEEVNKGEYGDAMNRMWAFEERFGESPESARLRRFLEQTLGVERAHE